MALLISIGLLYFFLFVCSSQVLLLFLFVIVTFICYCFFLLFACSSQVLAERQDRLRACLALFPAVDFKFIFIYPSLSSSSPFSSFLPSSFFSFIFIFTFLLYLHLHPHPHSCPLVPHSQPPWVSSLWWISTLSLSPFLSLSLSSSSHLSQSVK